MASWSGPASAEIAVAPASPRVCPECGGRYPAAFKVCPHDATPLVDADGDEDPVIGTTLGDSYQVVRVIGEGGMGRVYEARHTRLRNKRFAIKMLHDEYARQPDVVMRFQREAESASGIGHPNIVGVYDVHSTADGRPYIVGEFLEGEEFGALLDRVGKLEVGPAVHVVRQVCRALAAAHEAGVIHRDMKPENVFLVGDPRSPLAKVLDFGISKQANTGATLTQTGMVMGTPSYMAPEQARGAKVDHRADVYAAGAILYRALTGRKPFEGDPTIVLASVLTEEPPRPRQLEPSIPEALELVIQRAMAKEPADRYASMAALDAELAAFDSEAAAASATIVVPTSPARVGTSDKTLPALSGNAVSDSVARATREARNARPMLVLLSAVATLWVVGGLIGVLADCVRLLHGSGAPLSVTEAVLTSLGAVLAAATPVVLWVRHLVRRVWSNSVRAVQLMRHLRGSLLASVAIYGGGALLAHLVEGLVEPLPGGAWNIALFVLSLSAGIVTWVTRRS